MNLDTKTIKELTDDFQGYVSSFKSENTAYSYALIAKRMLAEIGGDTANITKRLVRKIIEKNPDATRSSVSSQVKKRAALKAFFKYFSNEYEEISNAVYDGIEVPKMPIRVPECLTEEEINRLMEAISKENPSMVGIRNRAMAEMMYGAGLRVQELIDLRIKDIDTKNMTMKVIGKGNKQRIAMLNETSKFWLKEYIDKVRHFFVEKLEKEPANLFVSSNGMVLTRNVFWDVLKKSAVIAGIEESRVHPHTLRHSFATHLLKGGANLMVIKELMGHSSIMTTQKYLTVDESDKKREYEKAFPKTVRTV